MLLGIYLATFGRDFTRIAHVGLFRGIPIHSPLHILGILRYLIHLARLQVHYERLNTFRAHPNPHPVHLSISLLLPSIFYNYMNSNYLV